MKGWRILAAAATVVLALPLINLAVGLPRSPLAEIAATDPHPTAAARVIARKCVHCHTSQPELPFYARVPFAARLIDRDIREGSRRVDYLAGLTDAAAPSEVLLAKTDRVIEQRTMPPTRFVMLHWGLDLTNEDRAALSAWTGSVRVTTYADPGTPAALRSAAIRPLPAQVDADPRKVELGRRLFHDPRLSGDDSVSCASCHDLAKGGTDQRRYSIGVGGARGGINSPTVFNASYNVLQFWDGRAGDLALQADGPVNNPIEMASNWEQVTSKLARDRAFTAAFRQVYPDGYSPESVVDAIAEFERTLITPDSPFDRFLVGDDAALDDEQRRGWQLFRDNGCATCHTGAALGGGSFEVMGLEADYFGDRGGPSETDFGRFNATGRESDRYRFKVPTLRNVALTWPYFHDGSVCELDEAVRMMALYQRGRVLAEADVQAMVAFLESLTGVYRG
ncbi:MAG TPA: cytochrome c peroxidase [Candidatus Polarisedimenticolaceae bacterium]|nr:cytochrome c peroxidase [Candidatus Polarisedimenticolaceae bacterium]